MGAPKFPEMPGGLTPDWLTSLLRSQGYLKHAAITGVVWEQVGDGTGMMSEVGRLRLTYDGNPGDLPPSLVAKYPSQNPTNRAAAMTYNLYERETRYFAELDPLTSVSSPRIYFADWAGDQFLLLMEDMAAYRIGDQAEGADLGDSQLMIDELAKLHAGFWQDVDQLTWVPGIADSYHADNMTTLCAVGWPNMCELFADFIDPRIAARGEAFQEKLAALQQIMNRAPVTLLHGDFRMENVFFGQQAGHVPIAIIDWQGPLLGKGMVDVALILAQSTRTEVRQQHEQKLLERYVAGLAERNVTGYDLAQALGDYRLALLYNWVYVSVVAGTLDVHNEKAFAWMSQMVARQSAASLDHNVFALLTSV